MQDRIARAQLQLARDLRAGPGFVAIDDLPLCRALAIEVALFREKAQKTVLHLLFGVGRDKGAFALAADQQILGGQLIDGFAHRALADFVAPSQLGLAGNGAARFPFARLQTLGNQRLDLLVERAEGWRSAKRRGRTIEKQVLLKGFDFLIAVIGLFGIGEILLTMEEGLAFKGKSAKLNPKVVWETWKTLPRYWLTFIRSTAIGCWMGITPGGATPASFMSYGIAQRMSKDPESFGKGQIEGVLAPETAAHAAGTSALLPMLTLGIPGSPTAAVLLGGLMIWGLQPGPMLFVEHKDFVWGLIASMYLGNIVGLLVVLTTVPYWAAFLRIPFSVIAPVIVVICAIGAYTVHSSMFDVVMMMVFGVVGYLFKKLKYPMAPLVLALVLGDMAEASFRQSMLLSQGDVSIFWSNKLVGGIAGLAMVMLIWPLLGSVKSLFSDKAASR